MPENTTAQWMFDLTGITMSGGDSDAWVTGFSGREVHELREVFGESFPGDHEESCGGSGGHGLQGFCEGHEGLVRRWGGGIDGEEVLVVGASIELELRDGKGGEMEEPEGGFWIFGVGVEVGHGVKRKFGKRKAEMKRMNECVGETPTLLEVSGRG